jgi:hypothetical protein
MIHNISTAMMPSIDELPQKVADDLDCYSMKAIEKYMDRRKGR